MATLHCWAATGRRLILTALRGAVQAGGTLLMAVGTGGSLLLSNLAPPLFVIGAGGQMQLFVDAAQIRLDAGVLLGDLVNSVPQVLGSRIFYAVRLLAPQTFLVYPGVQMHIPLAVSNFGPAGDTYRLSISLDAPLELPSILPVSANTLDRTVLRVTVPITAATGSVRLLAVTAASFADESVHDVGYIQLIVQARRSPGLLFLPWVARLSAAINPGPENQWRIFLPAVSQESGVDR